MGRRGQGAGRCHRAPGPRLGQREPPEPRGRHGGVARRLQRSPARGDRIPHAAGLQRPAVRQVPRHGPGQPQRRTAPGARQRHARLRARRRRTHWRGARALRGAAGAPGRTGAEIQRERARRHGRLCLLREHRGTRRRSARRATGRAGGRAGRGPRGLQAHAEDAVLPARHAVRAQQRAARKAVPRLRHARLGPGRRRRAEVRQRRADPGNARAAPRRSPAAGLPELCRSLAGAQDGELAAAGDRLPARPRATRQTARLEGPGRSARICPVAAGTERPPALGLGLHLGAAQGAALRLQRAGSQAVLHGAQGTGRPVQDRRDAVRGQHRRRPGAGLARRRFVLPHRTQRWHAGRRAARTARAVLPGPGSAQGQARRRMDERRTLALAAARRRHAADARGPPRVQLCAGHRRQACAAHARRRDHAVPRIWPRPAAPAHTSRRDRRFRDERRRVGRG